MEKSLRKVNVARVSLIWFENAIKFYKY